MKNADIVKITSVILARGGPAFATNKKNAIFPEREIGSNVDDI